MKRTKDVLQTKIDHEEQIGSSHRTKISNEPNDDQPNFVIKAKHGKHPCQLETIRKRCKW